MPAVKTKRISTLIESQLPEFITTEYELFTKFVQKYYEAQEVQGGTLDVINNIQKYADIDYYEKNILKQHDRLNGSVSSSDTTLTLVDAQSFPAKNGFVKIGDEIVFYETRTDTQLLNCHRGVSGNTRLGDLYESTEFASTVAQSHINGAKVYNVSNLFLYAFVKNFEKQYLGSFPEKYLKGEIDKRTLIKNIQKFYKSKGTTSSIKFIFNTIVAKDINNKPEVYKPREFTYKASNSDWVNVYALKVKVVSGNPKSLIGKQVVQTPTEDYGYASATVDNVYAEGTLDGEVIWNIVLAPETVNGIFGVSTKTRLERELDQTNTNRIDVFSTVGWDSIGEVLIGEEVITFEDKNVNQFYIKQRGASPVTHAQGTQVYKPITISNGGVKLLTLGVVYDFSTTSTSPYSSPGDKIQVSDPGFKSKDPRIVRTGTNNTRWILNDWSPVSTPTNPVIATGLDGVSTNVSAILADEQYYYITSSGYPSYTILDRAQTTKTVLDQKLLRIIRKTPTITTEVYKTPKTEVGILLNGVRVYGYKDSESIRFGNLEEVRVETRGRSYQKPPFVIIEGDASKASAVLSGQVVDRIVVNDKETTYLTTPRIEISSGRDAKASAVVTGGEVTSIVIDNPGVYYSSPPIVRITDRLGKGRFAEYEAVVDQSGKITEFVKISGGSLYTQNNIVVDIIAVGEGCTATPILKEWIKNRFYKYSSELDSQFGTLFENYNNVLENGYGQLANPKALRVQLNDNLNSADTEPTVKTHSPILGFAYDGNPIYGPFAHQNPLDSQSPIVRMTSSYSLRAARGGGPSLGQYPLGSFIDDYKYNHKSGSLDENNGRFCITPDFPEGVYAYFVTIDSNQVPQFPYIVGDKFYSLPVDSNYNSNINQNDIPKDAKRFFLPGMPRNGEGLVAQIDEVKSGSITGVDIDRTSSNFSVNSKLYFDNLGTEGKDAEILVSSVKGKQVNYLQSKEDKVVKLTTIQSAYLFVDDTLRQPASGASGKIVGTVTDGNTIVLKNVVGTFNNTGTFSADIKTFILTIDQDSSYSENAILSLTDGKNPAVAKARVLEGTSRQNVVKIRQLREITLGLSNVASFRKGELVSLKDNAGVVVATGYVAETTDAFGSVNVFEETGDWTNVSNHTITSEDGNTIRDTTTVTVFLDGNWIVDDTYFLQSDNLFNTSGSQIVTLLSLSDNLEPFEVNQSVALIETASNHGLGIGDKIVVDINPSDTKTKTYYLRKRLYQSAVLRTPKNSGVIDYDGIGRFTILNGGADYTEGVYNNVPITGGSGTGATASITVSAAGLVNDIQIQDGGSGYKRGDYLGVDDDQLERSGASLSSSRLAIYVDHAGVSLNSTEINLKSSDGFAEGDEILVGSEVVKITSIVGSKLTVERAQRGTEATDHFNKQPVELFRAKYNFDSGFSITGGINSGIISSYNQDTQEINIIFDYSVDPIRADELAISTTFFDSSSPKRLVTVESVGEVAYKFEFSEDQVNYTPNININIQEFYKYVFDTSHSSLTATYFDLSPSKSLNLITLEKTASSILPGNAGAFTEVKFGFGSRLAQNTYTVKRGTNFTNFYYYDRNGIVNSEDSYLTIVTDPLQGIKTVNYVTPNRFVYDIPSEPLWDGSGSISYTTTGQFAIGEINDTKIVNSGDSYKKLPLIKAVAPTEEYRGSATVLFDESTQVITSVRIDKLGSNYVKPIAIITDGDGVGASFRVVQEGGKLFSITVENPGRNYTYAPTIDIVESDIEMYASSTNIGIPQSIKIINNGGSFHLDKTVASNITSQYTVSLSNFSGRFRKGELVRQTINNVDVMTSRVSEYRPGSNLLKLENVSGIIRENVSIVGDRSYAAGTVKAVFVSTFDTNLSSFFDNLGYYTSDKGRLGVANQKITDSFFYQDYSYVVKSKTSIEQWRDLIKSTTHPAGFKLFGQVDVETTANTEMPDGSQIKADSFSIIQLWDDTTNRISVESTKQVTTQTIQSVESSRIQKGAGSVASSEFNFNETRAFEFTLSQPFDGTFNSDGQLVGTTIFQVLDNTGSPFFPISEESLVVTLDGILQEPRVAYTVQDDKIIFAAPPLGPGAKLTGQSGTDLTPFKGTRFYGRCFFFKRSQYNSRYLRKVRNIFQRNGRWIDAANQIERNTEFIVEEAVGYGKQYYSSLDWSTKTDDYQNDIRFILDAYQHDLRFGGNSKVFDYSNIFATSADYITKNKSESLAIFKYVTNLAKAAVRNWDYTELDVRYIQGSKTVTVSNTNNLVIGMHISSGRAFSPDTKIVSIDSITEVTLSKAALVNSGAGAGGASAGITSLSGSTGGNDLGLSTSVGAVEPGNTFSVEPGDDLVVPLSFSGVDSATFFMSGVNNGTYYDASNLIFANKQLLQEEVSGFVYANYALNSNDQAKCYRDLGFLIDDIVYHLRFGGNQRVINFAQLYYTNRGYPYGEELTYINRSAEETAAAIAAWDMLGALMINAMRNSLSVPTYSSIAPVTLPVAADTQFPYCQEVESSIDTYISIVKDILAKGTGVVEVVDINENKSGYWTDSKTYSNYNIIGDPLLTAQECNDVISSVDSLYSNLDDILNDDSVDRTLPDYVDGETKEFELYWEDGSPVVTESDENFLLTINAVLQQTKFNADYPGSDSYHIERSVVPNRVVFDVAPIWDQYEGAKTLGEPTAVEKIAAIGIGNYKRLTIDKNLVNNVRTGPFLILDLEDLTVANIEQRDNLLVFLDGVLQIEGFSYTVSGPNIFFNVPITDQMKVDMRYLYGRDVGQILNLYDYNVDQYYASSVVELDTVSGIDDFFKYKWMGDKIGSAIHAYQIHSNGSYNTIGLISNPTRSGSLLRFDCLGNACELIQGDPVYFAVAGRYDTYSTMVGLSATGSTITYDKDEVGRLKLRGNDQIWRGTIIRKSYKNPFISLSNNSQIRVEGEDTFRRIKELPSLLISKEHRNNRQVSNSYYGQVNIQSYNGITRGEGLSIVAIMEKDGNGNLTGRIERLDWNQRSYDPITQPTAYQYYTPPVINFVPENGAGGGARAAVVVSKGQVLSVELLDSGSGYTEAPIVVVARRYDIIRDTEIGVSEVDLSINKYESIGLNVISNVSVLGNQVSGINTFTSILFDSPTDTDRVITSIVTPKEEQVSPDLDAGLVEHKSTVHTERDAQVIDTFHNTTEINVTIATPSVVDIFSSTSTQISGAERQITTSFTNHILNDALSNINFFEVAAFLDSDIGPTDTVVYIPDTSKFKNNGYLLIGTETVRYYRKSGDRFLSVQRGENNTTAQAWQAGTYIRQIPDPVSIAYAGVTIVESDSQLVTVKGGVNVGRTERESEKQIVTPQINYAVDRQIELEIQHATINTLATVESDVKYKLETFATNVQSFTTSQQQTEVTVQAQVVSTVSVFTIQKAELEIIVTPPPSGIIDGYQESVFISDPVIQRNGNAVDLLDDYGVLKRNGVTIYVENSVAQQTLLYIGQYSTGNAGHTIGHYDGIFDDGVCNVSGLSIAELSAYFPSLTLRDFTERKDSSYTIAGGKFNLMPPSIQNPVAISSASGPIGGPLVVYDTTYFPSEGSLFTSAGSVIDYTSKTPTTFEGCTLVSGPPNISANDELVPFTK